MYITVLVDQATIVSNECWPPANEPLQLNEQFKRVDTLRLEFVYGGAIEV